MFKEQDLFSLMLVQRAREAKRLFTGQLYAPADIAEISKKRGYLLQPGWYLGGQMHPAMFECAMKSAAFSQSASVFCSSEGLRYALFTQRLGNWQHRFVVQLVGAQAENLLVECNEGRLCFSLADCDGPMATVLAAPADLRLCLPAGVEIGPAPQDSEGLWRTMSDCIATAALLLNPRECAGCHDASDVEHVCVTIVQGSDVRTQAVLSMSGRDGAPPH